MGASMEKTICAMLAVQFDAMMTTINAAIALPIVMARRLSTFIKRLINQGLSVIEVFLLKISEVLISFIPFKNPNKNKTLKSFCSALQKCKAARSTLVPKFISNANVENQEIFEEWVCRKSLGGIAREYVQKGLNELETMINGYVAQAEDWYNVRLNKAIKVYIDFLAKFDIVNTLNGIEAWGDCGFAACDFIMTAGNFQADCMRKLMINSSGDFDVSFISAATEKYNSIIKTKNQLLHDIDHFFDSTEEKIASSEVAKDFISKGDKFTAKVEDTLGTR